MRDSTGTPFTIRRDFAPPIRTPWPPARTASVIDAVIFDTGAIGARVIEGSSIIERVLCESALS